MSVHGRRPFALLAVVGALWLTTGQPIAGAPPDIRQILPNAAQAAPWTAAGDPLRYDATKLYDLIDGGAELYLQYGFAQAASLEYQRGEGSIICTVYEMKDPEAAFGIFSYGLTPKKTRVALGDGAAKAGFQLTFWQAKYYVVLDTYSQSAGVDKAQLSFAQMISKAIGSHAGPPAIVKRLPTGRLVPGTEKLFKGRAALDALFGVVATDVFQLGADDRLVVGDYSGARGNLTLFLFAYRDGTKAGRVMTSLKGALENQGGYRAVGQQGAESSWSKGDEFVVMQGGPDSLALVANASSVAEARSILAGLQARP
jgi:hypothetical protein